MPKNRHKMKQIPEISCRSRDFSFYKNKQYAFGDF